MASSKPPDKPAAADARNRRRPPTTIDLAATEVHVEDSASQAETPAPPDLHQAGAEPPSDSSGSPAFAAEPGKNVPEVIEQPPMATFYDEEANAARAAQGGGAPPGDEPPSARAAPGDADDAPRANLPPSASPAAGAGAWAMAGAALGGAAFVVLLLAGLYYAGVLVPRAPATADAALAERIARLESQAARASAPPAPYRAVTDAALKDLGTRLDRLETTTARPPAPATDAAMAARVEALETATKSAGDGVAALNGRFAEAATSSRELRERYESLAASVAQLQDAVQRQQAGTGSKADIDTLAARVSALEARIKSVTEKIDTPGGIAADRVRIAVLAAALRNTVERDAPFATELAAFKPLTNDAQALAALEPFAASGIPSAASLAGDLTALIPALDRLAAAPAAHDGTFLDRLQASAGRLVRIRPVEDPAGSDPAALVTRIEHRAARADIDGALRDLAGLPPAVRAPAEGWIAKAQRRQAALAAAQKVSADALNALVKPARQNTAE